MIKHISVIRNLFSPTDIANILSVSRPTVYAWIRGEEPSPENSLKLIRLYNISEQVLAADIDMPSKWVHRPVLDGLSLIQHIIDRTNTNSHIKYLKEQSIDEKDARAANKGLTKTMSTISDISFNTVCIMEDSK